MMHRIPNEDEFWEVFRDVTRKLAARCRRVRHSKKTRNEERDAKRLRESGSMDHHHHHHHLQLATTGSTVDDGLKSANPLLASFKGDAFNAALEHHLQINSDHVKSMQSAPL